MPSNWPVVWSVAASADLAQIVDYIADDSPANARRVLRTLQARAQSLRDLPERGRIVDAIALDVPLREIIEAPWRIVYTVNDERVKVVAVVDGRRDIAIFLRQPFGPAAGN